MGNLFTKLSLVFFACLVLYVSSYFGLSRLSLKKLRGTGAMGFYYVPCDINRLIGNKRLQKLHITLSYVYYPVWAFDYYVLDGPAVACIPMARIGG